MLSQAEPSFLNFWGLKCNRIDDGKTPTNRTIQEYTVAKQPKTLNRDYLSINSRSQSIFLLLLEAIGRLPFALLTRNYSSKILKERCCSVYYLLSLCVNETSRRRHVVLFFKINTCKLLSQQDWLDDTWMHTRNHFLVSFKD